MPCPDIFIHNILNFLRHLALIRTERWHGNFVISQENYKLTMKFRAKIKE